MTSLPHAPSDAAPLLQPGIDLSAEWAARLLHAQCEQMKTLLSWQRSLAAAGEDLRDLWICHFAGGVPIGA